MSNSKQNARIRAKAKTYIKRLESAKVGRTERAMLTREVNEIKRNLARSYRGSGYDMNAALQNLQELTVNKKDMNARRNRIFEQMINRAASGDKRTSLGSLGSEKSKIFYRATQNLWQGKGVKNRNSIILKALGVGTLGEAFDLIMNMNKDAVDAAKNLSSAVEVTNENSFFYNDESFTENYGSPDYLDFVNIIR